MLGIFFIYMDTQDRPIYRLWIHFVPTSLYPSREEKQQLCHFYLKDYIILQYLNRSQIFHSSLVQQHEGVSRK